MRLLVCGSRHWNDLGAIGRVVESLRPTVIIHGAAPGADSMAAIVAAELDTDVLAFPADWKTHGKRAGPLRNEQMLREGNPDLVLAFHEDPLLGKGTAHMVRIARQAGVDVRIFIKGADGVTRETTP